MDISIERIKITNYKRFRSFDTTFNDSINLIIGDNESGKSTILSAVDLVLSGSKKKVETIGLESIFNAEIVRQYLESEKNYSELPILEIELFLNDHHNMHVEGVNNSEGEYCHGLKMTCEPNGQYEDAIEVILGQSDNNFPFEYYGIYFRTFQGGGYSGYKNYTNHILLDNTQINNEYATKKYISKNYNSWLEDAERNKHENEYRRHKEDYNTNILSDLNDRIDEEYRFSVKTDTKSNLENDLTIIEGGIPLANKGKGKQCFIKTDFALQQRQNKIDIVLLEEPENHLSHVNMKRLIKKIQETEHKQLLIATHSDLICSRLNLRNAVLLNSGTSSRVLLNDLDSETAKFFIKSPNNNILEFILSEKVILVEGHAEYILMEAFYENEYQEKLAESGVHIITVGGTSFPRYLELADLLDIKTAVICDNDGDYQANCIDRFDEYSSISDIEVFYSNNNDLSTFEKHLYDTNQEICDELFLEGRRTLSVLEYMLSQKAEVAFQILDKRSESLIAPNYIKSAIQWIRQSN